MLDAQTIRADFPILRRQVHGKPLVYLDNAATSQKPESVIRAMDEYYRCYNANIHRGVHTLAEEATEAYENARRKVGRFINAYSPREVVFVRNTTEAINLVACSWGRAFVGPDDVIVLSVMEHHSNLVPWQLLAERTGVRLEFIALDPEGRLVLDGPAADGLSDWGQPLDRLLDQFGPRIKLVAVSGMSNVLGTINPIAAVAARAHQVGALLLVDGAQSVPHLPVDVQALGADFLAFSGHKMLGPTGTGVLYARAAVLEQLEPANLGGGTIRDVDLDGYELADSWMRFEGGTPNIAGGIGLGAAVDYMLAIGMDNVRRHEMALTGQLLAGLAAMPDVEVYGPPDAGARTGLVSFNVGRLPPHRVAAMLDEWAGIMVRSGHHCCHPLMKHLLHRPRGTVRASFSVYNTAAEVEALLAALDDIRHNGGGDWT